MTSSEQLQDFRELVGFANDCEQLDKKISSWKEEASSFFEKYELNNYEYCSKVGNRLLSSNSFKKRKAFAKKK